MEDNNVESEGIRIAFREERLEKGLWWCAYLASSENMNDALKIAQIRIGPMHYPHLKNQFIKLMKSCMEQCFSDFSMGKVEWSEPRQAPDSERQH